MTVERKLFADTFIVALVMTILILTN